MVNKVAGDGCSGQRQGDFLWKLGHRMAWRNTMLDGLTDAPRLEGGPLKLLNSTNPAMEQIAKGNQSRLSCMRIVTMMNAASSLLGACVRHAWASSTDTRRPTARLRTKAEPIASRQSWPVYLACAD